MIEFSKNVHELVVDATRIGLWDWNIQSGALFVNKRWAELIGYTLEELAPISIKTWEQFSHPDDLEYTNTLLEAHFRGETKYYDLQIRMKHKDGHWVWLHDRGKVFEWDEDGNPTRMCGSHIDISKEKQLELSLKNSINERDMLLKEVHHRVKNNLQLLLSITELKDNNNFISTSEMKNSIVSIAKAYEAIYQSDKLDSISIRKYFNQVAKPAIAGNDIEFVLDSVEFDSNIDFLVPLGLVISELITNSIKYAFVDFGAERKKIEIVTQLTKNILTIIYKDNGRGFEEETLQLERNATSFGMIIMQGLVQQLKGDIKFYNNDGACAKILLPV